MPGLDEQNILALNTIYQDAESAAESVLRFYAKAKENDGASEYESFIHMHSMVQKMEGIYRAVESLLADEPKYRELILPLPNGEYELNQLISYVESSPKAGAARAAKRYRQSARTTQQL